MRNAQGSSRADNRVRRAARSLRGVVSLVMRQLVALCCLTVIVPAPGPLAC